MADIILDKVQVEIFEQTQVIKVRQIQDYKELSEFCFENGLLLSLEIVKDGNSKAYHSSLSISVKDSLGNDTGEIDEPGCVIFIYSTICYEYLNKIKAVEISNDKQFLSELRETLKK